jgi:hypothetical protein
LLRIIILLGKRETVERAGVETIEGPSNRMVSLLSLRRSPVTTLGIPQK